MFALLLILALLVALPIALIDAAVNNPHSSGRTTHTPNRTTDHRSPTPRCTRCRGNGYYITGVNRFPYHH